MAYATTFELAKYLDINEDDLTDDADRLLDRASEMIDYYTLNRAGKEIYVDVEEAISWEKGEEYEIGDLVEHDTKIYAALQDHKANPSNEPPNLEYWQEVEIEEGNIMLAIPPETKKATVAQVEWWTELGDELGLTAVFNQISIGNFSAQTGGGQQESQISKLAPRAKQELFKAGLMNRGVNLR